MGVEPICAGMMAARRNAADLQGLNDCLDRVAELIAASEDHIPEAREWSRTTYEFHELVLNGSGNKTLALQVGLLQQVVATHYAATIEDKFAGSKPQPSRRTYPSFP